LNALNLTYGKNIVYSGPIYKSMKIEGNKIRLYFDHIGQGLAAKNDKVLKGFTIAGDDKHFFWADAEIEGETIVVSKSGLDKPVAVRYAWAANPIGNLYNKDGLPASPFRTDSWKGITQK
jgi:sialate O-acetylesterase